MIWEERWHPLREEWVIVAAHRQDRPWSGSTVNNSAPALPPYVPDCYLCPGNVRVSAKVNPQYEQTYVFNNDHPCVSLDAPSSLEPPAGLYQNRPAQGLARVVCYSPKHNLTLAELTIEEIQQLLHVWQEQHDELGRMADIKHVLIFENKGEVVGVSNPHPHCQIYATNFVFKTIETEARVSQDYLKQTGRVLFHDIIAAEQQTGTRIIAENESAIVFVPYFARYAYEVFVAPKKSHTNIATLSAREVLDFASVLKDVLVRFDNLWQMPFPLRDAAASSSD